MSSEQSAFEVRPIADRAMLDDFLALRWSGATIFIRGQMLYPRDVEAHGAYAEDRLHGIATWRIDHKILQLITLNNITDRRGVAVALLQALMTMGRDRSLPLMRVYVSNDNVDGLRFYQRRGFRLLTIFPGNIDIMRQLKPSVPVLGNHGIPMRDEIELECAL